MRQNPQNGIGKGPAAFFLFPEAPDGLIAAITNPQNQTTSFGMT
ncbi:hypothetical protein [Scytonema sp. NUACC21]